MQRRVHNLFRAFLACLTLAVVGAAQAAAPVPAARPIYFEHLTMRDGPLAEHRHECAAGLEGISVARNRSGLDRYDGYSIRAYRRERGNEHGLASDFHLDDRGRREQRLVAGDSRRRRRSLGSPQPIRSSSSGTIPRSPTRCRAMRCAHCSSTHAAASGSARSRGSTCSTPRPALPGTSVTTPATQARSRMMRCTRCMRTTPADCGSALMPA